MERAPYNISDKETTDIIEHIFKNAFGNPIIYDSAPENNNMKGNSWGFYNNEMYVKFGNNVCLKFTGTVVS